MIATDRQYAVSSDRLQRFAASLEIMQRDARPDDVFGRSQAAAIRAQMQELSSEISEYDELRSGRVRHIEAPTLDDLPTALIKARIARGLSQSALAELLGSKQQLVQRWEADGYRGANLATLAKVARALNVEVSERVSLAGEAPVPLAAVRRGLRELGFPKGVVEERIFPARMPSEGISVLDELDGRLRSLIGMNARTLARSDVALPPVPMRHKLPANATAAATRAYSRYVAGLCAIAAKCVTAPHSQLPATWRETRHAIFPDGRPTLSAALDAMWEHGIAVLPLIDEIAFHGACWRSGGRTVIVLKQGARDEDRWLFDLMHEAYHAATEPEGDAFLIIEGEESSPERRNDIEEKRANRFAAEVLTNGRTRELTDRVVELAGAHQPRLKAATARVAAEAAVSPGLLANLLAHRLAEAGNAGWWATAATLQSQAGDPLALVRDTFVRRADLSALTSSEVDIIAQCLETDHA